MPSSGSTIQRRPAPSCVSPPSSPRIASSGRARGDDVADRPLGGEIGLGDEIGRRRLRAPSRARPRPRSARAAARRQRARPARRARAGRRVKRPAAARRPRAGRPRAACASEKSVASSPGRATSWTDSGRPSASKPAGTAAAGLPRWFQTPLNGTQRSGAVERVGRAAALVAADLQRRSRERRAEDDVDVVEDRVDARGVGALQAARPRGGAAAPPRRGARGGASGARAGRDAPSPSPRRRSPPDSGRACSGRPGRSTARARRPRGRASAAARRSTPPRRASRRSAARCCRAGSASTARSAGAADRPARRPRRAARWRPRRAAPRRRRCA